MCERWGLGTQASEEGGSQDVRALAFSVFSGARRLLAHSANGKSLTGFGTAADANLFLQSKDVSTKRYLCALTLDRYHLKRTIYDTCAQCLRNVYF